MARGRDTTIPMNIKLEYVILFVADVERSAKFYADVFGLSSGFIADGGDYGEMKTGETTLSFSSLKLMHQLGKNPGRPDTASPVFEIAFEGEFRIGKGKRSASAASPIVTPCKTCGRPTDE